MTTKDRFVKSCTQIENEMKKHIDMNIQLPADFECLLIKAGFESLIKKI